jgi:hypothetical protein
MGQNFTVRLYSQVAIVKLIEKYHSDDETFQPLRKIIESAVAIASGSSLNSFNNLLHDFRFSYLEFSNLTSLDTVFHHIPRITGMPAEEIITFEMIQQASAAIGAKLDIISDKTLLNVPPQIRSTETKIIVEEVYDHHDNVQTKIVPVKTIKPDKQLIDSISCNATQNLVFICMMQITSAEFILTISFQLTVYRRFDCSCQLGYEVAKFGRS